MDEVGCIKKWTVESDLICMPLLVRNISPTDLNPHSSKMRVFKMMQEDLL